MKIYGSGVLASMRIAFRNMMRNPITVQYPHEKVELPERSRWAVAMKYDEHGEHKCTACIACERACPDHVIKIDIITAEDRSKHIDHWSYEIGACMMCGLCVEACLFDALVMSHNYELAVTGPGMLSIELLADTNAVSPKRKQPAVAAEKPADEEPSPAQTPVPPEGGADV